MERPFSGGEPCQAGLAGLGVCSVEGGSPAAAPAPLVVLAGRAVERGPWPWRPPETWLGSQALERLSPTPGLWLPWAIQDQPKMGYRLPPAPGSGISCFGPFGQRSGICLQTDTPLVMVGSSVGGGKGPSGSLDWHREGDGHGARRPGI